MKALGTFTEEMFRHKMQKKKNQVYGLGCGAVVALRFSLAT